MKHMKSCAAVLLALAAAQAASAQTTIRVTGSTAFRSATISSIQSLLAPGYDVAYTGTSGATGAQYATYVGTYSGNAVVIQCAWTGSVEGIRDVARGLTQNFIKASVVPNTNGTGVSDSTASFSASGGNIESAIPDIAMADNTQSATIYKTPSLKETSVGIIPFVFVKGRLGASHPGKAGYDSVTNITNQLAKGLLGGGAPLSFFTGSADASGTKLYAVGRNPLSGTRLVTFAETGFGATSPATQFTPVVSGSNITQINLTAADATNGFVDGDNGYTSGGTLASDLSKTVSDTDGSGNLYDGVPFGLVGYVGVGDAAALLKAINTTTSTDTGYVLAYNGVSLGVSYNSTSQTTTWDFTAIKEGKYSLWSVAQLAYRKSSGPNGTTALAGLPKTFADALSTNIIANVPSASGVKLSDMLVTRASEGAVITLK